MELLIIKGTADEMMRVLRELAGPIPAARLNIVETPDQSSSTGIQREHIDAFLRVLTDEQRSLLLAVINGASEREELMRKANLPGPRRLQTLLATIQRRARNILGGDARAIRSRADGDQTFYEVDETIVQAIRR
jgi:hypothetical protein